MIKRATLVLLLIAFSSSALAQRFNQQRPYQADNERDGRWEAGLLLQYQDGISEQGEQGSTLDFDGELGWGFAIGWNWTQKWNLGFRFALTKPGYVATIVPEDPTANTQTFEHTASRYSSQFNVSYNFLTGPLTPYVQAGIGWGKLDSNIANRPPDVSCWWDPWWGYICINDWSTYDSSGLSYNAGLGLRWDINSAMFLRGSWNREYLKLDRGTLDFDMLTFEAGFMW